MSHKRLSEQNQIPITKWIAIKIILDHAYTVLPLNIVTKNDYDKAFTNWTVICRTLGLVDTDQTI